MRKIFRRLRLLVWFLKAYSEKHRRIFLMAFLTGVFIFISINKIYSFLTGQFIGINVKKIAIVGNFTPSNLPVSIQNKISLGLTSLDNNGEASPSLALKWTVDPESKVYVFYLKEGLFWHDKTKFKAGDINYQLKDVKIEAINDTILKMTLNESFSPLITILSKPMFKKGFVGLGPYKVTNLKLRSGNLESLFLTPLDPTIAPLKYMFYPTEKAAMTAFKMGEVNTLEGISDVSEFTQWPNITISEKIYNNINVNLLFNLKLPIFQKKGFRQALAYAIVDLKKEKSNGPLNPFSWAYSDKVKDYSFNLETAKNLFEKEGLATESSQINLSTLPALLPTASVIASSWEKLGLKTNIKVENSPPNNFEVLLVSSEIPADPDQYHLWHSTQSTNLSGLFNPRIDKLLEDGRKTIDKEKRLKIYQDFQRYLLDECPAVFLYHPKLYIVERK